MPKERDTKYLGLSDGDLDLGYSDASSPDGVTRSNNDGLRSAYEEPERPDPYAPYEDAGQCDGMVERPGLGYKAGVRRN